MSIDTRLLKIGAQIKLKRSWKLNQPIPLAEVEAIESTPISRGILPTVSIQRRPPAKPAP